MLEKDLQEIGLNEKESKVYLATLELGQSVVQDIAKKAGINRATAYFVIEALMKMGLMSSFHKGKKQYFVAADPDRLIEVLEQEKNTIEKREQNLKKLLPQLQSINNKQADRPVVKYYEGKEGLMSVTEEFIKDAKDKVYMIYSVDGVNSILSKEEKEALRKKRIDKKIKTEVIYTYKDGTLENTSDGERRKIPYDKFPINCDIAIYNNKVRIASLEKKLVGIIIEDESIANSLKSLFKLSWEAAEKYNAK